jgi:hypothetical protein
MRKLIGLMAVVAALGLLGVSASGAGAEVLPAEGAATVPAAGTINVGPQPNGNPFEGGCHEGQVCIWSQANYSGQLSWWSEGNTGCKSHVENNPFRSFFNATSHDVVTFGGAGKYYPHSGNANPGALYGEVCIV